MECVNATSIGKKHHCYWCRKTIIKSIGNECWLSRFFTCPWILSPVSSLALFLTKTNGIHFVNGNHQFVNTVEKQMNEETNEYNRTENGWPERRKKWNEMTKTEFQLNFLNPSTTPIIFYTEIFYNDIDRKELAVRESKWHGENVQSTTKKNALQTHFMTWLVNIWTFGIVAQVIHQHTCVFTNNIRSFSFLPWTVYGSIVSIIIQTLFRKVFFFKAKEKIMTKHRTRMDNFVYFIFCFGRWYNSSSSSKKVSFFSKTTNKPNFIIQCRLFVQVKATGKSERSVRIIRFSSYGKKMKQKKNKRWKCRSEEKIKTKTKTKKRSNQK